MRSVTGAPTQNSATVPTLAPARPAAPALPAPAVARASGVQEVAPIQGRSRGSGTGGGAGPKSLCARLFEEDLRDLAATATLRPAAVRATLAALQEELQALQDEDPEDLFDVALGALEDEIRNADRLQAELQAAAGR